MDFNALKSYLLQKPGAVEEFPSDAVTLVIKVSGKMFAQFHVSGDDNNLVSF